MNTQSLWIYTHDSIGLGEDGPTHQPIEQLASLRSIPGLTVFRPADANETAASWRVALARKSPSAFALTRQNLPILDAGKVGDGVAHGAYVLEGAEEEAHVIFVATGSEVALAIQARDELKSTGVDARVVSMPSLEIFKEQTPDYRASVLPCEVPKVVIEAGSTFGWRDVIGDNGTVIGIDHFGESAPADELMEKFGFNVANVVEKARAAINRAPRALEPNGSVS